jgi:hypothetical protein
MGCTIGITILPGGRKPRQDSGCWCLWADIIRHRITSDHNIYHDAKKNRSTVMALNLFR